jgi:hypothetical protein
MSIFSENIYHMSIIDDFKWRTSQLADYNLSDDDLINDVLDIVCEDVSESLFWNQKPLHQ